MIRLFQKWFPFTYRAQILLKICLFACIIHGLLLLSSAYEGYMEPSVIRFWYNTEALNAYVISVGLSFLLSGIAQKTQKNT